MTIITPIKKQEIQYLRSKINFNNQTIIFALNRNITILQYKLIPKKYIFIRNGEPYDNFIKIAEKGFSSYFQVFQEQLEAQ